MTAGLLALAASVFVLLLAGGARAQEPCGGILPPCSTTTTPESSTTTVDSTSPSTTEPASTTTTEPSSTTSTPDATTTTVSAAPTTVQSGSGGGSSNATPVTEPVTTTSTPSLLVPGEDPSATAATTVDGKPVAAESHEDNTSTVAALVITSFLVAALIASLLTYRFWRNTRPGAGPPPGPGGDVDRRERVTVSARG